MSKARPLRTEDVCQEDHWLLAISTLYILSAGRVKNSIGFGGLNICCSLDLMCDVMHKFSFEPGKYHVLKFQNLLNDVLKSIFPNNVLLCY